MFSSELIIDADEGHLGWEIVLRVDAGVKTSELLVGEEVFRAASWRTIPGFTEYEATWTDLDDDELRELATDLGSALVETIIAERDVYDTKKLKEVTE